MMRRNAQRFSPKPNPFNAKLRTTMQADGAAADFYKINELDARFASLPFSIRVLLESAVRNCDEFDITSKAVENILDWKTNCKNQIEIPFKPARVVLQDFTGVPCVVDLAAMRDAMVQLGGDPAKINPQIPVDLVIDHSVQIDHFGDNDARRKNEEIEMHRNRERFRFLKWGSTAFENFRSVPPGSGIVHQVNLEYLAHVVFNNKGLLYPDSVVGTDSHTTMINGVGVAGWGVGGIEAEAAMLGQSLSMVLPKVVGFHLKGKLNAGVTATDLVLTVVKALRKHGVVGKFVEYYGEGLNNLTLADRATISNMAPEYGATVGYFPIDNETVAYLRNTGRTEAHISRITDYAKAVGMFRTGEESIEYTEHIELDLGSVVPCVSGPKRPQDYVPVKTLPQDFKACMGAKQGFKGFGVPADQHDKKAKYTLNGKEHEMKHGDIVIASITSCTNTSNPHVLITAGLLARNANKKGIKCKPWVKTSLTPGSHVVTRYLESAGLQEHLDAIGFNTTGYGCGTCIGNSGDIAPELSKVITENNMIATAVLSGNRNFEARVHPLTAGNYLASPPLVVAYALAGNVNIDFETAEIADGVLLKDIWPSDEEIKENIEKHVQKTMFEEVYANIKNANAAWNELEVAEGTRFQWSDDSTYVHSPPYFEGMTRHPKPQTVVKDAACLLYLGDSVTTDHISPAGNIAKDSPAAKFLGGKNVDRKDFNTYGSRRGNDEIMVRGTFANTRLGNKLVGEGQTGPYTIHFPTNTKMAIYDAAAAYKKEGVPLVVLAGKEYGSGSSRDWAAKGPYLQNIKVVITESYERIHRSNLVGMGIVPLQFLPEQSAASLGLTGKEKFNFDFSGELTPGQKVTVKADDKTFEAILRIDTAVELKFFEHGGILNYVLRGKLE